MTDIFSKEKRSFIMSKIHSKDTKPEIVFRKALWHSGIRYRKNYAKLPGKPDIVIMHCKIAIFLDGDFWHARDINEIKSHQNYWFPKLERNRQRDKEINDLLTEQGWLVLRFWESDIKKDLHKCVNKVLEYLS